MIHRHAVVTASSVAIVLLAGGTATALNLGVLASEDISPIGSASADAVIDDVAASNVDGASEKVAVRRFKVGSAGILTASVRAGAIHVDELSPSPGWTARSDPGAGGSAVVTFVGDGVVVTAHLTVADGDIVITSDEIVTQLDASSAGSSVVSAQPVGSPPPQPSGEGISSEDGGSGDDGDDGSTDDGETNGGTSGSSDSDSGDDEQDDEEEHEGVNDDD